MRKKFNGFSIIRMSNLKNGNWVYGGYRPLERYKNEDEPYMCVNKSNFIASYKKILKSLMPL
jgi:hypothetical protein